MKSFSAILWQEMLILIRW